MFVISTTAGPIEPKSMSTGVSSSSSNTLAGFMSLCTVSVDIYYTYVLCPPLQPLLVPFLLIQTLELPAIIVLN